MEKNVNICPHQGCAYPRGGGVWQTPPTANPPTHPLKTKKKFLWEKVKFKYRAKTKSKYTNFFLPLHPYPPSRRPNTKSTTRAKNTCLSIPNGPKSLLEKRVFDPFLTNFWSQNGPFSRRYGIFHGPKRVTSGSKRAKNSCLSIPCGLGTTLEKIFFFALGTLVDPPLAPTVWPRLPSGSTK